MIYTPLYKLNLPNDVLKCIDMYLGNERYWYARKQLTLMNAKLDLFSSVQWESIYNILKWHHWRMIHPCGLVSQISQYHKWSDMSSYLPLRCKWLLKEKDVYLLLRLFQNTLHAPEMLPLANKTLEQLIDASTSYASYYRQIVFH